MTTMVTLETLHRKLGTLGDAMIGNASLAEHSMTEPETFLALHEHVVEIQRMVEALAVAARDSQCLLAAVAAPDDEVWALLRERERRADLAEAGRRPRGRHPHKYVSPGPPPARREPPAIPPPPAPSPPPCSG